MSPLSRFVTNAVVAKVRKGTTYLFKKHLLLTNIGISATLSGVSDCIAQYYEMYDEPAKKYDHKRTFNMSVTGVTIGVLCHYWYIWLDNFIPGAATLRVAMKKMLIDQVICSPLMIGTFFATTAVLEGHSLDQFLQEVRCKAWKLYLSDWVVWPPVQLVNFLFVPLQYRVLYDNTISTCYDVYTSHVKNEVNVDCEASYKEDISVKLSNQIPSNSCQIRPSLLVRCPFVLLGRYYFKDLENS